jgi:hypothetical protein
MERPESQLLAVCQWIACCVTISILDLPTLKARAEVLLSFVPAKTICSFARTTDLKCQRFEMLLFR